MINYTTETCTRRKVQDKDSCCGTKCFHDFSLSTSSSPDSLEQCAKTLRDRVPSTPQPWAPEAPVPP